ncbi:hypothetical protein DFJ73DRAFT_764175 [Zopfochytrium polystomum]|nr:hypothetical protein DFJ73DRAFT_764175 [Zopfochytrium polystomum]
MMVMSFVRWKEVRGSVDEKLRFEKETGMRMKRGKVEETENVKRCVKEKGMKGRGEGEGEDSDEVSNGDSGDDNEICGRSEVEYRREVEVGKGDGNKTGKGKSGGERRSEGKYKVEELVDEERRDGRNMGRKGWKKDKYDSEGNEVYETDRRGRKEFERNIHGNLREKAHRIAVLAKDVRLRDTERRAERTSVWSKVEGREKVWETQRQESVWKNANGDKVKDDAAKVIKLEKQLGMELKRGKVEGKECGGGNEKCDGRKGRGHCLGGEKIEFCEDFGGEHRDQRKRKKNEKKMNCEYKITKGLHKGQECGKKNCKKHEKGCDQILKTGKRKGQMCGRKGKENGKCGIHKKWGVQKKYSESESDTENESENESENEIENERGRGSGSEIEIDERFSSPIGWIDLTEVPLGKIINHYQTVLDDDDDPVWRLMKGLSEEVLKKKLGDPGKEVLGSENETYQVTYDKKTGKHKWEYRGINIYENSRVYPGAMTKEEIWRWRSRYE